MRRRTAADERDDHGQAERPQPNLSSIHGVLFVERNGGFAGRGFWGAAIPPNELGMEGRRHARRVAFGHPAGSRLPANQPAGARKASETRDNFSSAG
jgi:hypothetical protein